MHRIKLNDRMTFPNVLNLNKFIDPADMVITDTLRVVESVWGIIKVILFLS